MKILVVCHGNVMRSQLAELAFRSKGFDVVSAGMKTKDGKAMAKKMRIVARELGYVVSEDRNEYPRSKVATQDLIDWADVIYYMDAPNLRRLNEQFGHSDKYLPLDRDKRVPDPAFHSDIEFWRSVGKQIQESVCHETSK